VEHGGVHDVAHPGAGGIREGGPVRRDGVTGPERADHQSPIRAVERVQEGLRTVEVAVPYGHPAHRRKARSRDQDQPVGGHPPVIVMLRRNTPKSAGTSGYCGRPTRLTTPPSRTTLRAVSMAGLRPTHSRTVWVPSPPVSSRTFSIPSSPRSATTSVAPNSRP